MAKEQNAEEFHHHPGRLLDRAQLMKLLGVTNETSMTRILANKKDPVPRVKIPNMHPKYPLDKILHWIENHVQ